MVDKLLFKLNFSLIKQFDGSYNLSFHNSLVIITEALQEWNEFSHQLKLPRHPFLLLGSGYGWWWWWRQRLIFKQTQRQGNKLSTHTEKGTLF